jgi:hypothetical protein
VRDYGSATIKLVHDLPRIMQPPTRWRRTRVELSEMDLAARDALLEGAELVEVSRPVALQVMAHEFGARRPRWRVHTRFDGRYQLQRLAR